MRTDQLQRQRRAWRRKPFFDCGCSEPCRCEYRNNPSEKRIDGYKAAIAHLAEHGLGAAALSPELRALWRRGGNDRHLAESVRGRWVA